MATVYRAYRPSMDRHAAVKVIRASTLGDEADRDRFQREAKLDLEETVAELLVPKQSAASQS